MSKLTIAEIDLNEKNTISINERMAAIGRELHELRYGTLHPKYGYKGYKRIEYCADRWFEEQSGPNWGEGTKVISISFYWARGEEDAIVTLPESWLEADWKKLEKDRIKKEKAARIIADKEIKAKNRKAKEERDRETYEKLKAKFEKKKK